MFQFPKFGLGRGAGGARTSAGKAERSLTLNLCLSDISCAVAIVGGQEGLPAKVHRECVEREEAGFCAPLNRALSEIPESVKNRIGNVVVYFDNPELSLVDSRQANIENFDKRTLSRFAHSHVGDGAIAVASNPYGKSTSLDSERKLIALIPEARLKLLLNALGKLAPYLTLCAPTVVQSLATDENSDVQAALYVHGYFSTLMIANGASGVVAVRQLSFGTLTLARSYADDLGLPLEDACAALERRPRLESPEKLLAESGLPLAQTGAAQALLPLLREIRKEVLTTIEYFSSNRLSGHPFKIDAFVSGNPIAGLGQWLSGLLDVEVECHQDQPVLENVEGATNINLLEASNSGLLKIGNQAFEFSSGKFVPVVAGKIEKRSSSPGQNSSNLQDKIKTLLSSPIGMAQLQNLVVPVGVLSAFVAAFMTLNGTIVKPASDELDAKIRSYQVALAQKERVQRQAILASDELEEPALWAEDIVAISDTLSSEAQLTKIALVSSQDNRDGQGRLLITGRLPEVKSGNLRLIGEFISDISDDAKLRQRLSEVQFSGATEAEEQTALGVVFEVSAAANLEGSPR